MALTIGWWAGNEPSESHEAIASMWKDTLDIDVDFHLGPFTVWHPTFVDRSFLHLVHDGEQGGTPVDFAKGREAQAWFAGGIMWSGGIPFYQRIYGDQLGEEDLQNRIDMSVQFGNHEAFWHWDPATYEIPVFTIYNGRCHRVESPEVRDAHRRSQHDLSRLRTSSSSRGRKLQ